MSDLKIALIGAGYIAKKHLEVIKNIKGMKVIAITSRTKKKAEKLSKEFNIKYIFNDYKKLINTIKPDGIMILVSSEEIFTLTQKIIPFNIPIFIEKPLGLNLKETKKLNRLAIKHRLKSIVGFNRRHYSNFETGLNIIKKKGKLLGITIEGHERFWKIENIISKKNKNSWLYSNSSHVIDLFRYFAGEISSINSYSGSLSKKRLDQFSSIIKFKSGTIGNYIANWYSPSGWSIKLHGEKVLVVFKPLEKGYWVDSNFKKHNIKMSQVDKKYKPGFYNQMQSFKKMLLTKKLHWPSQSIQDTLKTYTIIDQISSLKKND
ncbi:MAG: 4-carboxy-2-hydroxymuconate-6-semialdehyde dehydrogenase [Alphaproteobacteria bacterium MarineAlpha5_Bin8]|nr:MAG: 4-carboxy-2-hydroxymuconate-6-semialdehyde dehydrogenase [Alphaproteobacteria bacterium MarineAlpha5_Bin8]PPR54536.1 MAG: 4-carboxy-2-hydroxymuconate-6-semialdehyde dehydrogenase [Alphaproteobacteria bacterium MarineAlpha5_Bin6]